MDACNKCPPGTTGYDRNGYQIETLANVEKIYEGVFEADGVTPVMFTGLASNGRIQPGIYDYGDYHAYWNFNFIEEDLSECS